MRQLNYRPRGSGGGGSPIVWAQPWGDGVAVIGKDGAIMGYLYDGRIFKHLGGDQESAKIFIPIDVCPQSLALDMSISLRLASVLSTIECKINNENTTMSVYIIIDTGLFIR